MATKYRASAKGERFIHDVPHKTPQMVRVKNTVILAGKNGREKSEIIRLISQAGIGATNKQANAAFRNARLRGFILNAKATEHLKRRMGLKMEVIELMAFDDNRKNLE